MNFKSQATLIADSLSKVSHSLRSTGRGTWDFALMNGRPHHVWAHIEDEWLVMRSGAMTWPSTQDGQWSLLELNGRLSGPAKVALLPGQAGERLRAEISLADEVDVAARVFETCEGFNTILRACHGRREKGGRAASEAGHAAPDLAGLCAEAGWPFAQRGEGKVAVELETGRGFFQAVLEGSSSGGVRARVELLPCSSLDNDPRRALAQLLLTASGVVRMARAVLISASPEPSAGFEVSFGSSPRPTELADALSALSVACAMCGREAGAIQDQTVASRYLRREAR